MEILAFLISSLLVSSAGYFLLQPIFRHFPDRGIGFAPGFGIVIVSLIAWWCNHLPFVKLTPVVAYVALVLAAVLAFLQWRRNQSAEVPWLAVFNFAFWIVIFFGYLSLRRVSPDIVGIEKFPDFMILNSIASGGLVPPENLFVSEQVVNYYYFGHYMAAVLSKLALLPANWVFHPFMAYCIASAATAMCSLTMGVIASTSVHDNGTLKYKAATLAFLGFMASAFAFFIGNFHTFFQSVIFQERRFWYPDATRYIANTIHEFPLYSFLIGDLHGHVMNLPNALFAVALIFCWFGNISGTNESEKEISILKKNWFLLSLLGISFGASYATNSWDTMPTMLLAGITTWLAFSGPDHRLWRLAVLRKVAFFSLIFLFSAIVSFAPFWVAFKAMAQGLALVPADKSSPFVQLVVIWLVHATLPLFGLITYRKLFGKPEAPQIVSTTGEFLRAVTLMSFGLILFLEFFYFKDIYQGHIRANSLFKIGLFVWLALSFSTVVVFAVSTFGQHTLKKWQQWTAMLAFGFLFGAGALYGVRATRQYVEVQRNFRGNLDGLDFLHRRYLADWQLIQWLQENVKDRAVLVTAPQNSFSEGGRVNIFSGLPTIVTWQAHNWLWHGSMNLPMKPVSGLTKRTGYLDTLDQRVLDVQELYSSQDLDKTKSILQKYKIDFVLLSPEEWKVYPNFAAEKWQQLGELAFEAGPVKLYKIGKSTK